MCHSRPLLESHTLLPFLHDIICLPCCFETRVLVTHGVHWLPHVDVIIMMKDGCVITTGTYQDLITHDGPFFQYVRCLMTEQIESDEEEDPEGVCFYLYLCTQPACIESGNKSACPPI